MGYQSDISVTRRAAIGIAATLPVLPASAAVPVHSDRSLWDSTYREYRRLRLRMDAYYNLGPMNWLSEEVQRARTSRTSSAEVEAAQTALIAEEAAQDDYYKPVDAVALALVKMPAPDLDAVAIKLKLHDDHLAAGPHDRVTWNHVEEDLRRLSG